MYSSVADFPRGALLTGKPTFGDLVLGFFLAFIGLPQTLHLNQNLRSLGLAFTDEPVASQS